jgi:MFS family permease
VPEALFGVFMLSGAAGGLVGAVLADRLKSLWGTGLTMAVMNLASVLALVLIGAVPVVWVSAAGYFVSAFGVTVWNVLVMSLRQTMIPGRLLGRVHGTWRTLLWGTMPLGALIGGLIGRVDLALPFLLGGGLATVLALVFFRFLTTLPNPEDVEPPVEPGPTDPATRD